MDEQLITNAPLLYITKGGRQRKYLVSELPNGRISILNTDGSALRHPTAVANIIRYFGGVRAVLDFCRLSESEQLDILQSPAHILKRINARQLTILKRLQRRIQKLESELTNTPPYTRDNWHQ